MSGDLVAFLRAQLSEEREGAQGVVDSVYAGNPSVAEWQVRTIDAQLAILAEYEKTLLVAVPETGDETSWRLALELAVRHYAAVYSDHPGYQDEWKPS